MISSTSTPSCIDANYMGIFDTDWEDVFRPDIPFNKTNRLYISFGEIIQNPDGHFTVGIDGDPTRVTQIVNRIKAVNPSAQLFLTVGGDGTPTSFGGACYDLSFAANVNLVLNQFGLQGFDIDWEQDLQMDMIDSLLTNLYGEFRSKGHLLTFDVFPYGNIEYDYALMAKTLDQVNIMTYGQYAELQPSGYPFLQGGFNPYQLIGAIDVEDGCKQGGGQDTIEGSIPDKCSYVVDNQWGGMTSWRLDNDFCPPGSPLPSYIGGIKMWDCLTDYSQSRRALRNACRTAKKNAKLRKNIPLPIYNVLPGNRMYHRSFRAI